MGDFGLPFSVVPEVAGILNELAVMVDKRIVDGDDARFSFCKTAFNNMNPN